MRPLGKIVASLGIVAGIIMASAPVQARGVVAGHGAARRGPTYQTQHVNEIYVSITGVKRLGQPSYSSYNVAGDRYITVGLTISNHNDVVVLVSLDAFVMTDALSQASMGVDECGNDFSDTTNAESTRFVRAFQPRLCKTPMVVNNGNKLNPNQSVTGTLTWQLPSNQHQATLTWSPQGAMDNSINWPSKAWTIHY